MAKTNSTQPKEQAPIQAAHQRHEWLHDSVTYFPGGSFASVTYDIAAGIKICLELVEQSELDRTHNVDADPGAEIPPTLNVADSYRLLRLAISANDLLLDSAEKHIDWINSHGKKFLTSQGFTGRIAKSPYA